MKRLLSALLLLPALALAQSYPAKPIRIIVPFPAGGSIGANEAARAAPDGYTYLMVFDTHATNRHIYKDALDPFKHLEHLMLMVSSPSTLVAVPNFAPGSLSDLIAAAKMEPNKVTYASVARPAGGYLLRFHAADTAAPEIRESERHRHRRLEAPRADARNSDPC